jgi:hypothetical protein
MPQKNMRLVFGLLFVIVFLAGQFHFCADRFSQPCDSHVCPFCATTGSVVLPIAPTMAIIPVSNRFENTPVALVVVSGIPLTTSPRAPPAPTL